MIDQHVVCEPDEKQVIIYWYISCGGVCTATCIKLATWISSSTINVLKFEHFSISVLNHMGLVATKPDFVVFEKARLNPVSSATQTA